MVKAIAPGSFDAVTVPIGVGAQTTLGDKTF